jgi:hypothetical protein
MTPPPFWWFLAQAPRLRFFLPQIWLSIKRKVVKHLSEHHIFCIIPPLCHEDVPWRYTLDIGIAG